MQLRDAARLNTLYESNLLDTPAERAFDRLTSLAAKVIGAPVALVTLVEVDRQYFKSFVGLNELLASMRETPITHSFCQYVVTSGHPLIVENAPEHPVVCDNPAIRDFNIIAYAGIPLTLSNGQTLGSFCVIDDKPRVWTEEEIAMLYDLAEGVITEIELRLRTYALEARNRDLDAYSHIVAHDLRAPLSTIMGYSNLIQMTYRAYEKPDEIKLYADEITCACAGMAQMIDQLLRLARLNDDEIEITQLDIAPLVSQVLARFDHEITQTGVKINVEDFPPALGNPSLLVEVFANLIGNALKYADTTKKASYIHLRGYLEGGKVRYEVEDNGIGIAQTDQERMFEMFTRLDAMKEVSGFGLGLSIVNQIIDRMHGQVGVESVPGTGSIFWFTLPAAS